MVVLAVMGLLLIALWVLAVPDALAHLLASPTRPLGLSEHVDHTRRRSGRRELTGGCFPRSQHLGQVVPERRHP
jgi:hypothetical protein